MDDKDEMIANLQQIISLILSKHPELFLEDIRNITAPQKSEFLRKDYNESDFESYLFEKGLSANTVSTYLTAIKLFFRRYDKVSQETVLNWQEDLRKNCSSKTYNLRGCGMANFLEYAGISNITVKKVKIQSKSFCDNAINQEQYDRLINWAKDNSIQVYKIARTIASTGVRVSELIALKTSDLKRGYVDIVSKGSKQRRIYFSESLISDLLPFCNGTYIIENKNGQPITTRGIDQLLKKAAIKADIPVEVMHPHSFRHFFAKQFLKRNNDITLLGDILGHSNISTTAIYTRMTRSEQKEAFNKIVNW